MLRTGLLLLSLLAACAPTTVSYENVRITSDPAVPARCIYLGEVVGGGDTLTGVGATTGATPVPTTVPQDPITSLRQGAADVGANTVVVVSSGDSVAGSSITGNAFDCTSYTPQ